MNIHFKFWNEFNFKLIETKKVFLFKKWSKLIKPIKKAVFKKSSQLDEYSTTLVDRRTFYIPRTSKDYTYVHTRCYAYYIA